MDLIKERRQNRRNLREAVAETDCIEVDGVLLEEGIKSAQLSNQLRAEILFSGGSEQTHLDLTAVRKLIQELQQIGIVDNEVFGRNLSDGRIDRGIFGQCVGDKPNNVIKTSGF
jgi:hypothetical protein